MKAIKWLWCRLFGHRYSYWFSDGIAFRCKRCGYEDLVSLSDSAWKWYGGNANK